jgi:hypothetical protein
VLDTILGVVAQDRGKACAPASDVLRGVPGLPLHDRGIAAEGSDVACWGRAHDLRRPPVRPRADRWTAELPAVSFWSSPTPAARSPGRRFFLTCPLYCADQVSVDA